MKGRPVDPTRERRKTGHRRLAGDPVIQLVPEPAQTLPPRLAPPETLPEVMRPTWDRFVDALTPLATLREADSFGIEMMVRQYHRVVSTGEYVDLYGVLSKKESGDISLAPALKGERDATAMFLRLAEQYGLTLASRMRLGLMRLAGQTLAQALSQDLDQ